MAGIIDVAAADKAAKQGKGNQAKGNQQGTPEASALLSLAKLLGRCEVVKGKEARQDDDGGQIVHMGNVAINLPFFGTVKSKVYLRQTEDNGQTVVGLYASMPSMNLGGGRFAPIFRDVPQETKDAIAAHWQNWYSSTKEADRDAATVAASAPRTILKAQEGLGLSVGAFAKVKKPS